MDKKSPTVIAEIFVRVKISHSSVREFLYAINFRTLKPVSHTLVYVQGFRMLLILVLSAKKYEISEIKSRTKISAITVLKGGAIISVMHGHFIKYANTHTHTPIHPLLCYLHWPWDPLSSLESTPVSIQVHKQVDCDM